MAQPDHIQNRQLPNTSTAVLCMAVAEGRCVPHWLLAMSATLCLCDRTHLSCELLRCMHRPPLDAAMCAHALANPAMINALTMQYCSMHAL